MKRYFELERTEVNQAYGEAVRKVGGPVVIEDDEGNEVAPIVGENGVWAVSTQEEDGDYFDYFVSVHQSELDALRAALKDKGDVTFLEWGIPWQI